MAGKMACTSTYCRVRVEDGACVWCAALSPKPDRVEPGTGGRVHGHVSGLREATWIKSATGGNLEEQHISWLVKVFLITEEKKGFHHLNIDRSRYDKGVVLKEHLEKQQIKGKDLSGVMDRIRARHREAEGDIKAALGIVIDVGGVGDVGAVGVMGGVGGVGGVGGNASSTPSNAAPEPNTVAPAKECQRQPVPDSPELPSPQRGPVRKASGIVRRDLSGVGSFACGGDAAAGAVSTLTEGVQRTLTEGVQRTLTEGIQQVQVDLVQAQCNLVQAECNLKEAKRKRDDEQDECDQLEMKLAKVSDIIFPTGAKASPGAACHVMAEDVEAEDAEVQPGAAEVQPGAAEVQPGAAEVQPGAAEVQPGAAEVSVAEEEAAPGHAEVSVAEEEAAPGHAAVSVAEEEAAPGTVVGFQELICGGDAGLHDKAAMITCGGPCDKDYVDMEVNYGVTTPVCKNCSGSVTAALQKDNVQGAMSNADMMWKEAEACGAGGGKRTKRAKRDEADEADEADEDPDEDPDDVLNEVTAEGKMYERADNQRDRDMESACENDSDYASD
jgi:hypothetical protein